MIGYDFMVKYQHELGAMMIVDESRGIRSMTGKEWKDIKDFFMRLCL